MAILTSKLLALPDIALHTHLDDHLQKGSSVVGRVSPFISMRHRVSMALGNQPRERMNSCTEWHRHAFFKLLTSAIQTQHPGTAWATPCIHLWRVSSTEFMGLSSLGCCCCCCCRLPSRAPARILVPCGDQMVQQKRRI